MLNYKINIKTNLDLKLNDQTDCKRNSSTKKFNFQHLYGFDLFLLGE